MAEPGHQHPIIYLVARREILTRMRSPILRVGTIAIIGLIVVAIAGFSLLAGRNSASRVGFAQGSQTLEPAFIAAAVALGTDVIVSNVSDIPAALAQLNSGKLDVLVTGSAAAPAAQAKNTVSPLIASALSAVVLQTRLVAAGLPPAAVAAALAGARVPTSGLAPNDPAGTQKTIASLLVAILLYVSLGLYGSFVSQGVVEEKSTRIVEILIATVRPGQLLAGKILGVGAIALGQFSAIVATAFVMVNLTHVVSVPALDPFTIAGDLIWFLLGFLLYAAAYAAVAATVSRQEEVTGATAPVSIFLIASFLLTYTVFPNPTSPLSTLLSILPPFSVVIMPVRMASADAAIWQVALSLGLTILATAGLIALAGRIYANSVLRLGGKVRLRDALRRTQAAPTPHSAEGS